MGAEQGKEGSMNWEAGIDIDKLPILRIRQIANESILYSPGNSTQCFAVI